jgi:hypothetical protein
VARQLEQRWALVDACVYWHPKDPLNGRVDVDVAHRAIHTGDDIDFLLYQGAQILRRPPRTVGVRQMNCDGVQEDDLVLSEDPLAGRMHSKRPSRRCPA